MYNRCVRSKPARHGDMFFERLLFALLQPTVTLLTCDCGPSVKLGERSVLRITLKKATLLNRKVVQQIAPSTTCCLLRQLRCVCGNNTPDDSCACVLFWQLPGVLIYARVLLL